MNGTWHASRRPRLAAVVVLGLVPPFAGPAWGQCAMHRLDPPPGVANDFGWSVGVDGDIAAVCPVSGPPFVIERDGNDAWGDPIELLIDGGGGSYKCVAVSGDTVIVGAPLEDGPTNAGSVYIFERDHGGPGNWGQVCRRRATPPATNEVFGGSVSISGDTALVGTGYHGYSDPDGTSASAYIRQRDYGGPDYWGEVRRLTPSAGTSVFGIAVSIDGDVAIVADENAAFIFLRDHGGPDHWGEVRKVSVPYADVWVGADGDTVVIGGDAAVRIHERNQGGPDQWGEVVAVEAPDAASGHGEAFGQAVAINGDVLLVGAWRDGQCADWGGATYVFCRNLGGPDNWGAASKIWPANIEPYDRFGGSVAIDGDTGIIGSLHYGDYGAVFSVTGLPDYDCNRNGVCDTEDILSGDALDCNGNTVPDACEIDTGAGWDCNRNDVPDECELADGTSFDLDGNGILDECQAFGPGCPVTTVHASDGQVGDLFATGVAIDGDSAIVGAIYDDDLGTSSGSAYVFRKQPGDPNEWLQVAKLTASDGAADDWFGRSPSISGDFAIVGASRSDTPAGANAGAAYVFQKVSDTWVEVAKLTADSGAVGDGFGTAVTIDGDTAAVSAPNVGSGSNCCEVIYDPGCDDPDCEAAVCAVMPFCCNTYWDLPCAELAFDLCGGLCDELVNYGELFVFEREPGGPAWIQVARFTASVPVHLGQLGRSISLSGDTLIASGTDDSNRGKAYIFQRDHGGPGHWGEVAVLESGPSLLDEFGCSVSISGDTAIIGARYDDEEGHSSGAAYVFERDEGGPNQWGLVTKLKALRPHASALFGCRVSISGDFALVGAKDDNEFGYAAGAAYLFERNAGGADNWGQIARATAREPGPDLNFGYAVAIRGGRIIVGAPLGSNATAEYEFADISIVESCHGCPGECTGDGTVGVDDFLALLAEWGQPGLCDFDGGGVGVSDFLMLLGGWGPCP
jgi:hypothetical protein